MKGIYQQFGDWVREQPDGPYPYANIRGCALCQFLDAVGIKFKRVGPYDWRDEEGQLHDIPRDLNTALARPPHTFGALADRLATLRAAATKAQEQGR